MVIKREKDILLIVLLIFLLSCMIISETIKYLMGILKRISPLPDNREYTSPLQINVSL